MDTDENWSHSFIPWSAVRDVREDEDGVTLVLGGILPKKIPTSSMRDDHDRETLLTLARSRGELPTTFPR